MRGLRVHNDSILEKEIYGMCAVQSALTYVIYTIHIGGRLVTVTTTITVVFIQHTHTQVHCSIMSLYVEWSYCYSHGYIQLNHILFDFKTSPLILISSCRAGM